MRRAWSVVAATAGALTIVCAPAQAATKRCGSITDPKQRSVTVQVNITHGKAVKCTLARKVIRTYLKRVPVPRESTGENVFDVRVEGRKWSCLVTREVGAGRQTDYACARAGTNINAGPASRAAAAAPAPARNCGEVSGDVPGSGYGVGLGLTFVKGIGCAGARKAARRCIVSRKVPGWTALVRPDSHLELRSKGRRIVLRGIAGGGPRCDPRVT